MNFRLKAWHIYVLMILSLGYFAVETASANSIFFSRRYQTWNETTFKESLAVVYSLTDTIYSGSVIACLFFLALANIYFWQKGKGYFFLLTILYVAITSCVYYWLMEKIFILKKQNGLWEGGFSLNYFAPMVITILFALGVLVNYSLIKYLRKRKMKTA
jgi:hypothetical protein